MQSKPKIEHAKWLALFTGFLILSFVLLPTTNTQAAVGCVQLGVDPSGECYNSCAEVANAAACASPGRALSTPCSGGSYRHCGTAASAGTHSGTSSSSSSSGGAVSLPNPLGESDVKVIIARVIQGITGIAGSVALLMFVYGGFQWLTSQGNPEKIKKGRDILVWSALGLLVMFGSYLILRYILTAITTGTGVA